MSLPVSLAGLFQGYVFESIDEERHTSLIIKAVLCGFYDEV